MIPHTNTHTSTIFVYSSAVIHLSDADSLSRRMTRKRTNCGRTKRRQNHRRHNTSQNIVQSSAWTRRHWMNACRKKTTRPNQHTTSSHVTSSVLIFLSASLSRTHSVASFGVSATYRVCIAYTHTRQMGISMYLPCHHIYLWLFFLFRFVSISEYYCSLFHSFTVCISIPCESVSFPIRYVFMCMRYYVAKNVCMCVVCACV